MYEPRTYSFTHTHTHTHFRHLLYTTTSGRAKAFLILQRCFHSLVRSGTWNIIGTAARYPPPSWGFPLWNKETTISTPCFVDDVVWGSFWGPREHIGNLKGTCWEQKKNEKKSLPSPSPYNLKGKKSRHFECMPSLSIGCMKFLFPKLFITIFGLG
jgi:hypothetical protein